MKLVVSGSVAFDRIMDFPGKFSDHLLPDKLHNINVCFMINNIRENFGGTAGNIAYTLSLLGETPIVISQAGKDFDTYHYWLKSNNIPTDYIKIYREELTAGAYITTDCSDNQVTCFNPGAMKFPSSYNFDSLDPANTLAIVSPGNLDDMMNFCKVYKQKGIRYIFDPGQSLPAWSGEKLIEMITGAYIFISNDYELNMFMEKTSKTLADLLTLCKTVITTKGDDGSSIHTLKDGKVHTEEIPIVQAAKVNDPTGAGDTYRGGLLKGLSLDINNLRAACDMGATAASFCVEVFGPQNYRFTQEEFNKRCKK
ncbi:MAG: carbohydrate kinase family protein [Nitrospirae bacterium]|nr:carbohydrate kinase family protein [Nitrospirota bacterium]MBF0535072.1 carbohydrate kinase family protein [Nitrospirota bacterium]MBF0616580.1 carbohydrate kinase family protein [Nitrospirota bacterium]